ncbi:Phosphoheptose isomerase [Candidatus Methylopumilus planktonicus]|uniref:Phosphoheptose isomerase n=1 Tax=Candidatus Methylopumilus planktonicus TaxID=1581557 RepID=A0A0D6EWD3_9PROT|nr:D-sedoheptulose 7-phosphate isomerase [Candidatus Methylopumilus planktonicus]CEZ19927.1 Phosphoheptose isomerase [Candidatus Methylopumilus planktonicus]
MSNENLKKIESIFNEHQKTIQKLTLLIPQISEIAGLIKKTLHSGGKVLIFGNGGSASDSQHIAAEIVGRFVKERKGLPAIALTTDTSIITAVANDYGYEHIFSRQIEALCLKHDVVIGISTSGNSKNVIKGLEKANTLGAMTIGLTGGDGGLIKKIATHAIVVDSNETARIQEAHILIGHTICELIDEGQ